MPKVIVSIVDSALRRATLRHLDLLDEDDQFEFIDGNRLSARSPLQTFRNYSLEDPVAVAYQVMPRPEWPHERADFGKEFREHGYEGKLIAYTHNLWSVRTIEGADSVVSHSSGNLAEKIYEILTQ